jgi:fructan beta-fructosidase
MKKLLRITLILLLAMTVWECGKEKSTQDTQGVIDATTFEQHRPRFHFTPKSHWMNDPNGMVFHNNKYHLFYQHYPEGMVWGPMHWGHAVSKDLVHWEHKPIALYPDSLGLIFSGSAVVDAHNTTGFGDGKSDPLVAIFTYHNMPKEKAGDVDYQTQGIAYSLDDGETWKKYDNNPVLKNPGIRDYRDPKVFWHEASKQWIMILAVQDHVELYGSANLKQWKKLSEFGKNYGGHGGVWECPDLFEVPLEGGQSRWVMLVSINPGGPNGGSATQYFVGTFDGTQFTCQTPPAYTAWIDYGPDNYAGVTWSNAPDQRRIFLGWMSNWVYAQQVPTDPWRSAMTIPRELSLSVVDNHIVLRSTPAKELIAWRGTPQTFNHLQVKDSLALSELTIPIATSIIKGSVDNTSFDMVLSNGLHQTLRIGYDAAENQFFIDRSNAGKIKFSDNFFKKSFAPRLSGDKSINFTIVVDVSSVEVFFDDGLTVMTSIFFPDEDMTSFKIVNNGSQTLNVQQLEVSPIKAAPPL